MPSPVQPTNGNVARGKTQSLDKRRRCPPLSPSQKPLFREGRESANVKESRSFHAYVCQGGGGKAFSYSPLSLLLHDHQNRFSVQHFLREGSCYHRSTFDCRPPPISTLGVRLSRREAFLFGFAFCCCSPPPLARKERGNKKRIWVATRPARHRVGGSAPSAPFRLQQRNLLTLSSE